MSEQDKAWHTAQLTALADRRRRADEAQRAALDELLAAIVAAVDAGMSERRVAQLADVNRVTVRRALARG